jgi:hypothetical protein
LTMESEGHRLGCRADGTASVIDYVGRVPLVAMTCVCVIDTVS